MTADLRTPWRVGGVEIPTRLVLAPMAGVSVQAFRRQGRRFGAGLVCSEMVSCAGLTHGNERTLGYLLIAEDEHPLAVQIFGSDAGAMAEAARLVEAAGADIVDINFGCPVRKVTKTGAGATLLDDPDRACRVVDAVASAVDVPVTVKMRRGVADGSRTCLEVGPRLVEAGAAALTLHPRSAQQMYTGSADHGLTAELVGLVDVPVIASGDIDSHERAVSVLEATGAAAVMVGRAAQGNPWVLAEIVGDADAARPSRAHVAGELLFFIPEAVRELTDRDFRACGKQYLEETRIYRATAKPRFTDKLPNNFSHGGFLHLILPHARVINARRHPLDSCLGSYKQLFGKGQNFTYDIQELGLYYRQYHATIEHWHRVLPGKVLDVHYEDMVCDFEVQVRRILEHCGLPFEESCLRFHETPRTVRTASSEQVRQPLYARSLGLWRRYERHLGEWKEELADIIAELPERVRDAGL